MDDIVPENNYLIVVVLKRSIIEYFYSFCKSLWLFMIIFSYTYKNVLFLNEELLRGTTMYKFS